MKFDASIWRMGYRKFDSSSISSGVLCLLTSHPTIVQAHVAMAATASCVINP
jgi:hypothetical protein